MQVLHVHWHPPTRPTETDTAGMLFWAEDSEGPPPVRQKGKKSRVARLHPFYAEPGPLAQLLQRVGCRVAVSETKQVKLLLPTTTFGPQPSPQLQHDWEIETDQPADLAPWLVPGFWLKPAAALTALITLPDPAALPPHLALGADAYYWHVVANLVLETLAQQKILPVLAQADAAGKIFHARWLPVLDGPQDGPRLARLLEAMPPLCRAETETPEAPPSPRLILDTFLNTMADALARDWGRSQQPAYLGQDPAHAWLKALFPANPAIISSPAQLSHLHGSHRLWLRNLHVAGDKTFRVAFRLEAPAQQAETAATKNWQLHYLLQARDDPSLLVPAEQVWQTKGNVLTTLNRRFEQPQEKLLAGLGYAARLFEPLRSGLKTAKPVALPLATPDAFNFLRESAPLLESSGFGVLVPPWWNKPGTRLGVRLKLASHKGPGADVIPKSKMSLENLIRYKWELSLGDTTLTREEFEALVALKSPLVQIRGQWVQLDPEQIEAAIRFWEKQDLEAEVGLHEAVRLGLGATETVEGLPVEQVEYEGWLADWMERFTGNEKLTPLPQPQSLQAQLRPYQQYGYSWLDFLRRWGMGACLADDMGLGKCVSADTLVAINGDLQTAATIWEYYAGETQFDEEGFWAVPLEPLQVNAIDEQTGQMTVAPIRRLYRQHVREKLRCIKLKDGSQITITRRHQLLTDKGWTNELKLGDYVCVQQLQHLLDQEVYYCPIKAIEEVEYEGWVYDFEVAGHHNFVANNILCHNTIQTIAMLLREKEESGRLPGPTLLICPTSVVTNWAKEVQRFAPTLTTLMHQGPDRLRAEAFTGRANQTDLVLTSYAVARRDIETLKTINWFGVVLDEAQNIKNPEAKQTRAIRQLPAQFRLALTGTPVENRLSELWSIMHFLNPGYLGVRQNFRQNFALPIERYGDEEITGQLKKMISPFILRRVKTDPTVIQDLPEKQELKVYCNLSEEQATLYESVVKNAMEEVEQAEGIERKGLVLGMLMKLKQVCNHPAQFLHQIGDGYPLDAEIEMTRSGKLARLTEMLEEAVSVGDRVLIFTQFAEMGHLLKEHLQQALGVSTLFLYGQTPAKKREVMVKRFQEETNGPPIFILSLKAGGTGLNLTRANHVFHFDRWWNPAVENQATDRAFRIGQTRNVLVHKFVCIGTMEEMIDDMIESKKALAQSVVGGGENWLTELSTGQLRDMVTLRREGVA